MFATQEKYKSTFWIRLGSILFRRTKPAIILTESHDDGRCLYCKGKMEYMGDGQFGGDRCG